MKETFFTCSKIITNLGMGAPGIVQPKDYKINISALKAILKSTMISIIFPNSCIRDRRIVSAYKVHDNTDGKMSCKNTTNQYI